LLVFCELFPHATGANRREPSGAIDASERTITRVFEPKSMRAPEERRKAVGSSPMSP
jgi:hypothetical protein